MSDAARIGYRESGGSIDAAQSASELAHANGIEAYGSEADYVAAHGQSLDELRDAGVVRSMISVTTDPVQAGIFAGDFGTVFSALVDPADLLPGGEGESEFLLRHMFGATPVDPAPEP